MIKMPIACLLILLYVGYYYSKKQQLPIYSTRMFKGVYVSALFHLIMDIITEYTVNHRDIVPDSLNYILHVLFLFSIMGMFWYIYLYLLSYVEQVKKVSRTERVIKLAVLLVVMLAILVLPIEYIDTPHGAYSLGPKAYALYAGTVYTLILIICCTLKNWKILSRNKRETMVLSVMIFALFSVIQIVIPYSLLTGLAITLITIGIIMSNENPDPVSYTHLDVYKRQRFPLQWCLPWRPRYTW